MKKMIAAYLVVCLIFVGLWVIPVVGEFGDSNGIGAPRAIRGESRGNTIYVGSNQTYKSIQTAIDAASPGDTVYVYNGTYTETGQWYYDSNGYDHYAHFLIRKSITLIGEDKNTTIIEGNYYGHVIDVRATNVTISGFTVRKSGKTVYEGRVGLQFNDADNCMVTDNIFTDNYLGVGTHRNHRLTIKNNKIYSNKVYGIQIHMYSPDDKGDTIIDSNEIYNNGDGIYQRFHYYGLGTITNNKIYNNTHGIDFLASYDKIIAGNEIRDNKIGIYFERGINNTIKNNVIKSNQQYGIYIDRYYPYTNYYAPSINNHIYHNYLISNGVQAYENNSIGNEWNHTTLKEGNYWSDYEYRYPEAGNDGKVWKIPYNITGNTNATDYYPLCNKTSQIKIPPTLTTKDRLKVYIGKSYSVIYYAYDPDTPQYKLTWTMKTNASWLNFSTEQKLNGTPLKSDIGTYWVYISVSDGNSSDYTNFTLTVLDFSKPQITTIDVQSAYVGKLYSVIYFATDPDTAQEKLTWTMRSNASWLNFSSKHELYGIPSKADIGT